MASTSSPNAHPAILWQQFLLSRQQINAIVRKCADLMEALYSPAPPEPEDDLSSFAKRSDEDVDDLVDIEDNNATVTSDGLREVCFRQFV